MEITSKIYLSLLSQALRKLTGVISKTGCCMVFTNQLREKVGIMFGSPEVTPGGKSLKFYSSIRIDIRRKEAIKFGDEIIGNRTKVKVVKNKIAPPFRESEFDIMYGKGISKEGSLLDLAVQENVIQKAGAWFSYRDERLGQGRENAKKFLAENNDICMEIETKLKAKHGM